MSGVLLHAVWCLLYSCFLQKGIYFCTKTYPALSDIQCIDGLHRGFKWHLSMTTCNPLRHTCQYLKAAIKDIWREKQISTPLKYSGLKEFFEKGSQKTNGKYFVKNISGMSLLNRDVWLWGRHPVQDQTVRTAAEVSSATLKLEAWKCQQLCSIWRMNSLRCKWKLSSHSTAIGLALFSDINKTNFLPWKIMFVFLYFAF